MTTEGENWKEILRSLAANPKTQDVLRQLDDGGQEFQKLIDSLDNGDEELQKILNSFDAFDAASDFDAAFNGCEDLLSICGIIGRNAQAKGLTEDILEKLLADES